MSLLSDDLIKIIRNAVTRESNTPDEQTKEEKEYLDEQYRQDLHFEEVKGIRELNKTLQQNNAERKKYANRIFFATCCWGIIIFAIIFLQGFKVITLSGNVLITLITSTTLNFFGFFILVIKYLFYTGNESLRFKKKKSLTKEA